MVARCIGRADFKLGHYQRLFELADTGYGEGGREVLAPHAQRRDADSSGIGGGRFRSDDCAMSETDLAELRERLVTFRRDLVGRLAVSTPERICIGGPE